MNSMGDIHFCDRGFYGNNCLLKCNCTNNGGCSKNTGLCFSYETDAGAISMLVILIVGPFLLYSIVCLGAVIRHKYKEVKKTKNLCITQNHKISSWPSFKGIELTISTINNQRPLCHLHITEWSDHLDPSNITYAYYLSDFCRRCQQLHEKKARGVVVHCSTGVGRAFSFLALSDLLIKYPWGIKINKNVKMRRMKDTEKSKYYDLTYEQLIEKMKLGPISVPKDKLKKFYNNLKDYNIERSRILYQHQVLSNLDSNNKNKEIINFLKLVTSSYNFCLMTNDTNSISWQNIPETQCIIILDPILKSLLVPKVDHPNINGQICVSLVNERITEWGEVCEVQKNSANVTCFVNVVVDAYEDISVSTDKNIKICLVDKKEDYLDFLTFMDLFSQLPNDANIAIISGKNVKLGSFFEAACNIISK